MSTASARSARAFEDDDESSTKPVVFWLLSIGGVLVVAFLIAWLLGWIRFSTDPRLAEIQKLQSEYREKFMANGGPSTLDEAKEAVAAMGRMREKMEELPPQMRGQAWAGGGGFRTMMQQRINSYFALPPDKRQAELDRQIKQEDLMRQAFEAARAAGGGGPGGGGAPGGGGGAAGGRGAPGGGPGAGGPGGQQAGRGGPSGGPPRGGSEDERNNWRKRMIDSTSPQQRAQFTEYRRAMDARRDQLGLPPSQWR